MRAGLTSYAPGVMGDQQVAVHIFADYCTFPLD